MLSIPPPAHFFSRLSLKSEIMDGFWSSKCLNDHIDLPDKIESFLSSAATPMVVKSGTKKIISYKNTKNYKNSYEYSNKKNYRKQTPPKVGILILDPISKFLKVKNETPKRPCFDFFASTIFSKNY